MNKVLFSAKQDNWLTPESVLDRVRGVAPIAYDPCTFDSNPTGARQFDTADTDGLSKVKPWYSGLVFVNEPYSQSDRWAKKIAEVAQLGGVVVQLTAARTETRRWHRYIWPNAKCVCFLKGRLKFAVWTEECGDKHNFVPLYGEAGQKMPYRVCVDCAVREPSCAPFPSAVVLYAQNWSGVELYNFDQHFKEAGWIVTP